MYFCGNGSFYRQCYSQCNFKILPHNFLYWYTFSLIALVNQTTCNFNNNTFPPQFVTFLIWSKYAFLMTLIYAFYQIMSIGFVLLKGMLKCLNILKIKLFIMVLHFYKKRNLQKTLLMSGRTTLKEWYFFSCVIKSFQLIKFTKTIMVEFQ